MGEKVFRRMVKGDRTCCVGEVVGRWKGLNARWPWVHAYTVVRFLT